MFFHASATKQIDRCIPSPNILSPYTKITHYSLFFLEVHELIFFLDLKTKELTFGIIILKNI